MQKKKNCSYVLKTSRKHMYTSNACFTYISVEDDTELECS